MTRIVLPGLLLSLAALLLAGCQESDDQRQHNYDFDSVETLIESRGVRIPVTYVHPLPDQLNKFPLVMMAHGHGGSREEAGGFTAVAAGLAAKGIASIRMDFPGCGESSEPFTQNNLSNMLEDVRASRDFALRQPNVDRNRVGLLGFSMGGRLAMLASAQNDMYSVMVTWAPVATNGEEDFIDFMGGRTAYDQMKAEAIRNGFAPFTTPWGQHQLLDARWFSDMEELQPIDAIRRFEGRLLVICGNLDDVVLPAVCEAVVGQAVNSAEVEHIIVAGANHGLGFYTANQAVADPVIETTVDFLSQHLLID